MTIELSASDTELIGKWELAGGKIVGDSVCRRIEYLLKNSLIRVGADFSGWNTLYRDPSDQRLWELSYPNSESQGGGAPKLQCISQDEARKKYLLS